MSGTAGEDFATAFTGKQEQFQSAITRYMASCDALVDVSGDRITVSDGLDRFVKAANTFLQSREGSDAEGQKHFLTMLLGNWNAFMRTQVVQSNLEARLRTESTMNGMLGFLIKANRPGIYIQFIAGLCHQVLVCIRSDIAKEIYQDWEQVIKAYGLIFCDNPRIKPLRADEIPLKSQLRALGGSVSLIPNMKQLRRYSQAFLHKWGADHGGVNAWFEGWGLSVTSRGHILEVAEHYGKLLGFEHDRNSPPPRQQNALSRSHPRGNRFFPERRM